MTATHLLTTTQVAVALNLSPRHVRHLINTGVLPAQRYGPAWLVRTTDLARARVRRRPGRPRAEKRRGQ